MGQFENTQKIWCIFGLFFIVFLKYLTISESQKVLTSKEDKIIALSPHTFHIFYIHAYKSGQVFVTNLVT